MSDIAIKVENLSKAYQLGQIGTGTVSNDIHRWWTTKIRGKEDPFLKIGETNDRSVKGESNVVWSLKDINFEINQGDAVGIIGKNGAGKSTLLKLLSRVTAPTTGNIKVKGRIASLLEVGTGFHPELTGRENIYLNGAILGMRKKEITRKFDEIVDFSGVERYIDTPVKRYSSGMYVRLAFAVAAHLESEILIVDEVLAVGDAEFQKKCLGKMGDVSKSEGRTILFVSHNMASVESLCSKGIILKNGKIDFKAEILEVIKNYNETNSDNLIHRDSITIREKDNQIAQILFAKLEDNNGNTKSTFGTLEEIYFESVYKLTKDISGLTYVFNLQLNDKTLFLTFDTDMSDNLLEKREPGLYKARFKIPYLLKPGKYNIKLELAVLMGLEFDVCPFDLVFEVVEGNFNPALKSFSSFRAGEIGSLISWETQAIIELPN